VTLPDLPQMDVDPPSPSIFRNLSVVWLVPLLALLISFGVAWKSYSDRGVLITIALPDAAGVTARDTVLKFREVVIGNVESVRFAPDFKNVIVSARIDRTVADILPADAEFWVVQPNVSASGVTGLSTVLSGVYIEGAFIPTSGSAARNFQGLPTPPMVRPGREGTTITLRSDDGSHLPKGGPVLFHGIEVGRLDVPRLSTDGDSALVEAFINAPYDKFLTTATRFWDTSGFSVKLGPDGINMSVASLGSLLNGGVAFDTTFTGGQAIAGETVFTLFPDETAARQSIYTKIGDNALAMAVIFEGSVNGLQAGAPVEYLGLRVGQVTGISAFVDTDAAGKDTVKVRAAIEVDPQALGLKADTGEAETLSFLQDAVAKGMRARLTTTSLFSSALKIELVDLPDEPAAVLSKDADNIPILPSVASNLPDFTATAEGVFKRINALPIEDVMDHAVSLMASIEAVASSDGVQKTPDALVKLLNDAQALVNSEDTQALPGEIRGAVDGLNKILADLQQQQAVNKLVSVLENADKTASDLANASKDFPALVADLRDVAGKAKALKAEDLIASATQILDSANALIGTDAAKALPADLSQALAEIQAALQELREGGAVANTNAALAAAKDAANAVSAATSDLPKITSDIEDVIAKANALVAGYGPNSAFNTKTLDLLRELQAAAKAITQLAKSIERKPNSLLIGR
jgi:paraquat-inducible protein B